MAATGGGFPWQQPAAAELRTSIEGTTQRSADAPGGEQLKEETAQLSDEVDGANPDAEPEVLMPEPEGITISFYPTPDGATDSYSMPPRPKVNGERQRRKGKANAMKMGRGSPGEPTTDHYLRSPSVK